MQSSAVEGSAPSVACVLVNWNNWQDTCECLASLRLQDYPNLRVLVVDNGSTNDSLAELRRAHPWATYIENPANLGFPKACNIGARHPLAADADFLWLLNNDTTIPPDTTRKLVDHALAKPRAGLIGAVLFYAHQPTRIQSWGGGRISLLTGYNFHHTAPTPLGPGSFLTFACAFIRREVFTALNGLTEDVFMYFEDSDFCMRAQAAGWQLAVAPETAVLHKEGGSISGNPARALLLEQIVTASGLVFLSAHAPHSRLSRFLFITLRLGKRLLFFKFAAARAVLRGLDDFRHHRIAPSNGIYPNPEP